MIVPVGWEAMRGTEKRKGFDMDATRRIRPRDIDCTKHFFSAFGNSETETSANWIVKFCQSREDGWFNRLLRRLRGLSPWEPFNYDEIEAFYKFDNFTFNRLIKPAQVPNNAAQEFGGDYSAGRRKVGGGWITKDQDGKFHISHEFVARCYKASPKTA